jgi:hypothetical protein
MQDSDLFPARRKPIFTFAPPKIHHISIQSSQTIPSLKGDQTFPYELEKIVEEMEEYHK